MCRPSCRVFAITASPRPRPRERRGATGGAGPAVPGMRSARTAHPRHSPMTDLRNKTALVTGGARRIGRAIALRLASEGVRVAISYLTSPRDAEATLAQLRSRGVEALAFKADLSRLEDCEALVREAGRALGNID